MRKENEKHIGEYMDKKTESINFKNDVIKLYKKGYAVNAIAVALNKKYNGNMDGLFFTRFKKRIGISSFLVKSEK